MTAHSIQGQIISATTKLPIEGVKVEAWDKDLFFDDLLGTAVTGIAGDFHITFDEKHYREIVDRRADVYFKVFRDGRLIASSADQVLWNVKQAGIRVIVPVWDDVAPGPASGPFQVSGQVATDGGRAAADVRVEAYDHGLDGATLLGSAATDAAGRYALLYELRGKARADLQVVAVDPRRQRAELARSAVHFEAAPQLVIDLVVAAAEASRPTEYERLFAAVTPLLGGRALASLEATAIDYVASRARWDARLVAMAAQAARLSHDTQIPAPHYYALMRAGVTSQAAAEHQTAGERVASILTAAITNGVIPDRGDVDETVRLHRARSVAALAAHTLPAAVSSLGAMLDLRLDAARKATFVEVFEATAGDPARLWDTLAARGFDDATVTALKNDGKLGRITLQNAPLVARLRHDARVERPEDLAAAGLYRADAWLPLIGDDVPAKLSAADYAAGLAVHVNLAYPTLVAADLVGRGEVELAGQADRGEVAAFLRDGHTDHRLGREPVKTWRNYRQLSPEGQQGAMLVERLYQLSPSNQAMTAMSRLGLHSARQIARYAPETFEASFGAELPVTELRSIHRKAQEVHATTLHLATTYLTYRTMPDVYVIHGASQPEVTVEALTAVAPGIPTLEDLFHQLDYCACEHCKSVLGPAAYLVDLFEFLDPQPRTGTNPLDFLFARRPDLRYLALSCENTNIALPYVDLVNEVLETVALAGDLAAFKGHDMRTDSATADILAEPQFVEAGAYDLTKAEVYPAPLPFDLPIAALRLLFGVWDVGLADALRVFGTAAESRRELLGLDEAERRILTDRTFRPLPAYFGEADATPLSALDDAIADGKTFCLRTDIRYVDLVAILKTRFINPNVALVPLLEQLHVPLGILQQWYTAALDDAALKNMFPPTLATADYGGDVLAWLTTHQADIMGLVTLTDLGGEDDPCDFSEVELRFAHPDLTTNHLTELVWHKLHRFIRLWKKLGWSIELTDVALHHLAPPLAPTASIADLDAAFVTLLARLANVARLVQLRAVTPKRRPEWLALWDTAQDLEVREAQLARLLRVSPTDLRSLAELSGADPFADDLQADAPSMLAFVDALAALAGAGLKVTDLDYLLRHKDTTGKLTPGEPALLRDLKALRDGLTAAAAELALAPDNPDLALVRGKLALVYDTRVLDHFFGLVGRSLRFTAPLVTAEEDLPAAVAAAAPGLAFDPFARTLSYAGVLSAAAHTAAVTATAGLSLAELPATTNLAAYQAALTAALLTVRTDGAADLAALAADAPELAAAHDTAVAIADPATRAATLLKTLLPSLGAALAARSLRVSLAAVLKLDPPLVDVLTSGAAVVHAAAGPSAGITADFLALGAPLGLDADGTIGFFVDAPTTDDYILQVAAPAGTTVTLTIGTTVAIPATVVGAGGEVSSSAGLRFQAGALAAAELTLVGLPAASVARLRWRTRGMARTDVPADRLYARAPLELARASLLRLHKAALLLRLLPMTPAELHQLAATDPGTRGFLDELDVTGAITAPALHALWNKLALLVWFAALKRDTEPTEDTWVALLVDPALENAEKHLVIEAVNGWKAGDLAAVLGKLGLVHDDLRSLANLRRVKAALDLVGATGQPAADVIAWSSANPTAALVQDLRDKVRASQDPAAWRTSIQSVNDVLRNRRRDALIAFLLHHRQADLPGITTADQLYEHFLIDVQMDACMQTSRIRQALSSVQQFVNRCLMNLEPDVSPELIPQDQWAWMKRYRVWEANRKIFLFPENWLEPELRNDKSPFFRELEAELLKADITDALAEEAYLHYLKKLDEVARLEIVATCVEARKVGEPGDDVLHVFGRTGGSTRTYWHRRLDAGYWTAWEKVPLKIEGDLLFPVVWKQQLFLFWFTVVEKAKGADTSLTAVGMGTKTLSDSTKKTAEVSFAWGELYRGKWTSPKSTEMKAPVRFENLDSFNPDLLVLLARTDHSNPAVSERLVFSLSYPSSSPWTLTFTSKNCAPIVSSGSDAQLVWGTLLINGITFGGVYPATKIECNEFRKQGKTWAIDVYQPENAAKNPRTQTILTKQAPLFPDFRVRTILQPSEDFWSSPLFYSDEHSVFHAIGTEHSFVVPAPADDTYYLVPDLHLEIDIEPLYEKPLIDDPIGPIAHVFDPVVNPRYHNVLPDNQPFQYAGAAFDAGGLVQERAVNLDVATGGNR